MTEAISPGALSGNRAVNLPPVCVNFSAFLEADYVAQDNVLTDCSPH
jgi:hypothetical protein